MLLVGPAIAAATGGDADDDTGGEGAAARGGRGSTRAARAVGGEWARGVLGIGLSQLVRTNLNSVLSVTALAEALFPAARAEGIAADAEPAPPTPRPPRRRGSRGARRAARRLCAGPASRARSG